MLKRFGRSCEKCGHLANQGRGFRGALTMAQCESSVFFPDDPAEPPQFSDCPRPAETSRRTWRRGDVSRGEARLVISVVKLCTRCAKEWDEHPDAVRVQAARA